MLFRYESETVLPGPATLAACDHRRQQTQPDGPCDGPCPLGSLDPLRPRTAS